MKGSLASNILPTLFLAKQVVQAPTLPVSLLVYSVVVYLTYLGYYKSSKLLEKCDGLSQSDGWSWGILLFLCSALSATVSASLVSSVMWDGANVSGHVASHIRPRPPIHGTMVASSAHLPSDHETPVVSRSAEIFTVANDPLIRPLMAAWREWCPRLLWQLRP